MIVFSSSLQDKNNLTKYEGFFVFDLWLEIISRLWKKSVGFLLPISSFLHVISDAIILDPSEKKTSDFQENIWHPLFQCLFFALIFHYFVSFPGFLFTLQANGGNCERESFWKRVWHQTGAPLCPWLPSLEIPLYFLPLSLIQFTITTINITIIIATIIYIIVITTTILAIIITTTINIIIAIINNTRATFSLRLTLFAPA